MMHRSRRGILGIVSNMTIVEVCSIVCMYYYVYVTTCAVFIVNGLDSSPQLINRLYIMVGVH